MFNLASLTVDIRGNKEELDSTLAETKEHLETWGTAAGVAIGEFAVEAVHKALEMVKEGFNETIGAAMKLEAAERRLGDTLGEQREKIMENAEEIHKLSGAPVLAIEQVGNKFAMMARMAGQSTEQAAQFTNRMTDVILQTVGRTGKSFEEAGQMIFRGIQSGGGRGLKELGLSFTTAQVNAEAMAEGMRKVNGVFSQGDLQMARAALLTKALGAGHGELTERLGTTAMTIQQTQGVYEGIYETIGKDLMPVYRMWVQAQQQIAQAVQSGFTTAKPYLESFVAAFQTGYGYVKTAVASVIARFGGWNLVMAGVAVGMAYLTPTIYTVAVAAITAGIGVVATWFPVIALVAGVALAFKAIEANAAFFKPLTDRVKVFGMAIKEWVMDKVELAGIAWRNFPLFVEIAAIKTYEKILNMIEYFKLIPANLKLVGEYVQTNWRKLMTDAINAVGLVLEHLGENIGKLPEALKNLAMGKGWHPDFTSLLDGFKPTADKLPEMLKAALIHLPTDVQEAAIAAAEKIRTAMNKVREDENKGAEKKKLEAREVAAAADATTKQTSTGIAAFSDKLRASQGESDPVPKQQLQKQTAMERHLEIIAKNVGKTDNAIWAVLN